MFIRSLWNLCSLFSLYYRCSCCILGCAVGDFRQDFHILRTPWFEVILSSTKKTTQPLRHFFYLALRFASLEREKKKQLLLSVIPA